MSREARKRLVWFDYYYSHGRKVPLTCRHFGIRRQTFYRWKPRYDPRDLSTLEDRSHRPRHRRQPTWIRDQAEGVRCLRERYPHWGKDKLAVLLGRRRGLTAPRVLRVKRRRATGHRPWALHTPRDYAVEKPGDLVFSEKGIRFSKWSAARGLERRLLVQPPSR